MFRSSLLLSRSKFVPLVPDKEDPVPREVLTVPPVKEETKVTAVVKKVVPRRLVTTSSPGSPVSDVVDPVPRLKETENRFGGFVLSKIA